MPLSPESRGLDLVVDTYNATGGKEVDELDMLDKDVVQPISTLRRRH
jgi:hypothetical protein